MTRARTGEEAASADAASADAAPMGTTRADWDRIPERLRARGLRWTPQRATLLAVLARADGHVTGSRLVDHCRALDPETTPSTVYRTLGVLEELGVIRHSHGLDGREEFHVLPVLDHGHLICTACGAADELPAADAEAFLESLRHDWGFETEIGHLTVMGRCRDCSGGI